MGNKAFSSQKSEAKDESENSAAKRASLMLRAEDRLKKSFFNIYNIYSDLDKEMKSRLCAKNRTSANVLTNQKSVNDRTRDRRNQN